MTQTKLPKEIVTFEQYLNWIEVNQIEVFPKSKTRDGVEEYEQIQDDEIVIFFCNGKNEIVTKVNNLNRILNFFTQN